MSNTSQPKEATGTQKLGKNEVDKPCLKLAQDFIKENMPERNWSAATTTWSNIPLDYSQPFIANVAALNYVACINGKIR